jgi:hypothetical protein
MYAVLRAATQSGVEFVADRVPCPDADLHLCHMASGINALVHYSPDQTPNYYAWSVMEKLGFSDCAFGKRAYTGDVVLSGNFQQPLTLDQMEIIRAAAESILVPRPVLPSPEYDTYPKLKRSCEVVRQ